MTQKFKAGDKVVRTEIYTSVDREFMIKGGKYVVNSIHESGEYITLVGSSLIFLCRGI